MSLISYSQTQTGYVEIKGKVKKNGKSLSGAQVTIFENSKKVKTVNTASNGKFIIKLDFDKKYVIEFSKKSFVTKKVSFDTHVEEKQYVWPYPFTIELFETMDGLDVSALKDPVTKIAYSQDEGDFVFDIPYTNGMKTKLNQIQNKIEALKRNAYNLKIAEADKKFREKAYDEAIKLYEASIDINPYTDYPDDQIMECERRLSNADNEKASYEKAIASADAYFKQKKYELAKRDYKKASKVLPAEKYPKDKINEIAALLLAQQAKEKKIDYDNIIKKADALFARKEFDGAKSTYNLALKVMPAEQYPKTKLAEIDALLADQERDAKVNAQYADKITEGDRLYTKREYQIAKNAYIAASKIKPAEKYPQDRIKDIDSKLSAMKLDSDYAKKIQDADALLAKKELEPAKKVYQEALAIKSTESYPKQKIKQIDEQLATLANKAELEKNYSNLIQDADAKFASQNYVEAKVSYNKALALKSKEKYPQDKIKEIEGLLAKQASEKAKEEQYAQLIKSADADLSKKQYENAKVSYTGALKIKPNEAYPKSKITEIDQLLAELEAAKTKDKQYADAIKKADGEYSKKQLEAAKTAYVQASQIKPEENYPKEKIKQIETELLALADAKANEDKYNNFIVTADEKLKAKNYQDAKLAYESALTVKPNEVYPKTKLKEIESALVLLAENKAKQDDYDNKIKQADAAFAKKDYETAKTNFVAAVNIMPKESYPKQKITEIDKILSELASAAEKDNLYKKRIEYADKEFTAKNYEAAKLAYKSALEIKSTEKYPKDKISEIANILAEKAKKENIENQYQEQIATADKKLEKKDYQAAKVAYASASQLKPSEAYPKTKISEIDNILESMAADKEKEVKYNQLLKTADAKMGAKDYTAAKQAYESASKLKPSEVYPKDKLKEITEALALIAQNKAKEEEYTAKIKQADALLASKDYKKALSEYSAALGLKPSEAYPKQKMKEIDEKLQNLANAAEKEKLYNERIVAADKAFSSKNYQEAKLAYQSALEIKSSEQYPKDKISEITSLESALAEKLAKDKNYEKIISEADKKLSKKDYTAAKASYTSALELKPNETYPKDKISEIDKALETLAASKAVDEQYNSLMKNAEVKFEAKDYLAAKTAYQSASDVKPAEDYPKQKIKEIDGLLKQIAENKSKDENYNALIETADSHFAKKEYESAKSSYAEALALKSKESYPKQKIKEIDGLLVALAKEKAKDSHYQEIIKTADTQFASKNYDAAKLSYESALEVKPTEQYPKDKISEIASALALIEKKKSDAKALDEKYKLKVEEGDRLFAKREYQISKAAYEEASLLKPNEAYPKTKLKELEGLMAEMSKDMEYAAALKEGSDYISQKKYDDAKLAFQAASDIKPNESFPKDKIKLIDELIAKEKKAKMLAQYKLVMADAEKKFTSKDYEASRALYQQASEINTTAQYPKDRIKEIDKLLLLAANKGKADAAKQQKYSSLIAKGDAAFAKADYTSAKINYKQALNIFSTQAYPKNKLKEIEKLTAKADDIPEEIDFSNQAEKKKFISSMASKYGDGVHVENYESKSGKKVKRVIVVKDGLADEYREVKQPWGATYFFKNGKTVSRSIFYKETKK